MSCINSSKQQFRLYTSGLAASLSVIVWFECLEVHTTFILVNVLQRKMSTSFEAEEISNSPSVSFSPQRHSTTVIELEETELLPGPLSADEEAYFEAVQSGNKESVQRLLHDKQVDVNCRNTNGETALEIAVDEEAIDIIKTLLENQAEIGSTLFQAVRNNSLQCVRILVAYDSNRKICTAKEKKFNDI